MPDVPTSKPPDNRPSRPRKPAVKVESEIAHNGTTAWAVTIGYDRIGTVYRHERGYLPSRAISPRPTLNDAARHLVKSRLASAKAEVKRLAEILARWEVIDE